MSRRGAVEAGNESDVRISQRGNHLSQIVGRHSNIAVIHQQQFVTSERKHLDQIADFNVGSEDAIADDQLNSVLGIFQLQFADDEGDTAAIAGDSLLVLPVTADTSAPATFARACMRRS